ncbi:MAG: SAM-dependent methyltransferase [Burkholderiales bacterium]
MRALICLLVVVLGAPAPRAQELAPFITTPDEVVTAMLKLAGTRDTDFVMDLGSGDGRIVIAAARQFGARGLGVDLNERLVRESLQNAKAAGVADRVQFEARDVLRTDLSRASIVTIYLLPDLMAQLREKMLKELKPGSRIVAHLFVFPGWSPDRTEVVRITKPHQGQGEDSRISLWIVPVDVFGDWRAAGPGGEWRLRLQQNFQYLEVDGTAGGAAVEGISGRVEGERVSFQSRARIEGRMMPVRFEGRADGARIVGELTAGEGAGAKKLPFVLAR